MHQVSQAVQAIALLKLANYASERMSNDDYYLMEFVNIMIQDYGEDNLRKEIKDWDEKKKKLNSLSQLLAKSKTFYDALTNKKFDKMKDTNKVQDLFKKKYIKYASKIMVLQPELYEIAVYLINNSTINMQNLRMEYVKVLEYQTTAPKPNLAKQEAFNRGKP